MRGAVEWSHSRKFSPTGQPAVYSRVRMILRSVENGETHLAGFSIWIIRATVGRIPVFGRKIRILATGQSWALLD